MGLQALQERFGGWNSSAVVEPFRQYARTVFAAFGNRVQHWTTMNEPQTFCFVGYSAGGHAPGIQDQVGAPSICIPEELVWPALRRTWPQMLHYWCLERGAEGCSGW